MKKVSMWFVVDDETAEKAVKEMTYGNMDWAASILNENCEESDYNIENQDV